MAACDVSALLPHTFLPQGTAHTTDAPLHRRHGWTSRLCRIVSYELDCVRTCCSSYLSASDVLHSIVLQSVLGSPDKNTDASVFLAKHYLHLGIKIALEVILPRLIRYLFFLAEYILAQLFCQNNIPNRTKAYQTVPTFLYFSWFWYNDIF